MFLPANPAKSAVLDELGQAAHAAQTAYRDALATFRAGFKARGLSAEATERLSRSAFEDTDEGAKLAEAYLAVTGAHDAARELSGTLRLAGRAYEMAELTSEARDAVYRAAAEFGIVDHWPAAVHDRVHVLVEASRTVHYADAAAVRRQSLAHAAHVVAARIVETRGGDPTAWTEKEIDEVGRAAARVDAFDILTNRAGAVDIEWGNRRTLGNPRSK